MLPALLPKGKPHSSPRPQSPTTQQPPVCSWHSPPTPAHPISICTWHWSSERVSSCSCHGLRLAQPHGDCSLSSLPPPAPTIAGTFLISLPSCSASVHRDPRRLCLLSALCFCNNSGAVRKGGVGSLHPLPHLAPPPCLEFTELPGCIGYCFSVNLETVLILHLRISFSITFILPSFWYPS